MINLYKTILGQLDKQSSLLPLAARLVFAGVLLTYFWASAATKLESFPFGVSLGAYAQIFPRVFEAAGYNASEMGLFHRLVILMGTYAEYILPLLIVLGLFTRLAALGMIGFVVVQSATDIWGHKAGAATIGAWFDRDSASLIADQRSLWILLFLILVLRGAGPLSLDSLARRRFGQ